MKPFTTIAFIILLVAGLAHVWRLVAGFEIVIGGIAIPDWASAVAAIVVFAVAYQLRREART